MSTSGEVDWNTANGEFTRVVGGGVRRIREGLHPLFESVFVDGVEFDASEEVASCPRDP